MLSKSSTRQLYSGSQRTGFCGKADVRDGTSTLAKIYICVCKVLLLKYYRKWKIIFKNLFQHDIMAHTHISSDLEKQRCWEWVKSWLNGCCWHGHNVKDPNALPQPEESDKAFLGSKCNRYYSLHCWPQLYAVVQRFAGTPVYVEGVKRSEEKNKLWFTHNSSFSGILTAGD